MDFITNNSMLLLQKGLDFNWQKQRIISDNIANSETPGYRAKYVSFEDELRHSISRVSSRREAAEAIKNAKLRIHTDKSASLRMDGNNVNVDAENVELARAQIQYDYLISEINNQFSRLRSVIQGR